MLNSGFQFHAVEPGFPGNLDYGFQLLVELRIPWAVFWIPKPRGAFHLTKIPVWNFGNFTRPMERYISVAHTRQAKQPHVWLLLSPKKDTKERYWGQQFCQNVMERDISVRPIEMTRLVKVCPEYSGLTKPKWSVPLDEPYRTDYGMESSIISTPKLRLSSFLVWPQNDDFRN